MLQIFYEGLRGTQISTLFTSSRDLNIIQQQQSTSFWWRCKQICVHVLTWEMSRKKKRTEVFMWLSGRWGAYVDSLGPLACLQASGNCLCLIQRMRDGLSGCLHLAEALCTQELPHFRSVLWRFPFLPEISLSYIGLALQASTTIIQRW